MHLGQPRLLCLAGMIPSVHLDISALLNDGRHFARKTAMGSIEIIDSIEGTLVCIIKDPNKVPNLIRKTLPNGEETWVDVELSDAAVKFSSFGVMKYHPWIIDVICEKIASGGSITKICQESGMPSYPLLGQWRRKFPEVDKALEKARIDRAEYLRDRALEAAEDARYEDDVAVATLKHNARKWAAQIDDPGKYSPKAKVEATLHAPTQILVYTGIDRNIAPMEHQVVGEKNVQTLQGSSDQGDSDNGGDESAASRSIPTGGESDHTSK